MEKLSTQFSHMNTGGGGGVCPIDLESLLQQTESTREYFKAFLKEFNSSIDNLFYLYLICSSFCNKKSKFSDDRARIKLILGKTYERCVVQNELLFLSKDLKKKLCDTLQKATYNESVFTAVTREIKEILERDYIPLYLKSRFYNESLVNNTITSNSSHSTNPGNIVSASTTASQSTSSLKSAKGSEHMHYKVPAKLKNQDDRGNFKNQSKPSGTIQKLNNLFRLGTF